MGLKRGVKSMIRDFFSQDGLKKFIKSNALELFLVAVLLVGAVGISPYFLVFLILFFMLTLQGIWAYALSWTGWGRRRLKLLANLHRKRNVRVGFVLCLLLGVFFYVSKYDYVGVAMLMFVSMLDGALSSCDFVVRRLDKGGR